MCFMLMPTKAFADTTIVNEISLIPDMAKIGLNTAWTEAEVDVRVENNTAVETTGIKKVSGNCGLAFYGGGDKNDYYQYYGIYYQNPNGERYVSADKTYALRYYIGVKEGYDWPEKVKTGDFSSMKIIVNGDDVSSKCVFTYNSSWNEINFMYIVGSASTEKIVTKFSIDQTAFSLKKGESTNLTATVKGTVDDKSVVWSIDGAESASTSITSAGVLTIGEDETATSIKVTATSKADANKKASIWVTVLGEEPTIDSIEINDPKQIIWPGASLTISATVNGTQTNKQVTWSISGNASAGTTISDTGKLKIASDETAEKITVTATSVADPTKSGSRELTITPPTRVSEISINLDLTKLALTTAWKEAEVDKRVERNTTVETNGVSIISNNSKLLYYAGGDAKSFKQYFGISSNENGNGEKYVSIEKTYALRYYFDLQRGYEWPEEVTSSDFSPLRIYANGVDVSSKCLFEYDAASNYIRLIYVIGKAQCVHPATSLKTTISKATPSSDGKIETKCTVCGKVTETIVIPAATKITLSSQKYTYNGKEKKPSVVVKDRTGKVVAPENYSVAYASGRKKVGAYAVTVTFKGDRYSGSKKLTYNINPAKVSLSSVKAASKSMTVKWKKGKDVNGYEIQYSTSSSFKSGNKTVKVTSAKTTSKVIKKLKANKKYYVRIRTYKTVKGKKFYSDWSGKKTVKIKK